MTLLDRYLARQILWYTLLVMAVLMTLSALFLFLGQQDDVGTGTYDMGDALFFTALNVPQQFFQLLPIGALLGALIGLGNLARGSELVVIRAAGVSTLRLAGAAALAGTGLFVAGMAVGEFLAPPLEAYAKQLKTFGKFSEQRFAGGGGAWVKEGDRIVSVQQQSADNVFGGLYVYVLEPRADGTRRLAAFGRAEQAERVGEGRWLLWRYTESAVTPERVVTRQLDRFEVESRIDPAFISIGMTDPAALPVRGLVRYVQLLRANGVESRSAETALWSRISRGFSTILLCMLAVPFVLGPLRSSGAGSRTVIGILIGVTYFLVNRTLENTGEVYGLEPLLVAWGPAALLALVTFGLIWRVR
ncbi:MAG: LPS export ABC transporter permease LptG [Steroidobacteraceae bacterium]|jgi:lipopolysaccharide export system permease protein|nr:LPS export ABC transporter permease LptG [Steroidobacteraceae bacterium]